MNLKDDINLLFQKFIDKDINEEELKRFYTYVHRAEMEPEIHDLLLSLWDYADSISKPQPGDVNEKVSQILEKKRSFDSIMQEVNKYKVEAEKGKPKKENKDREPVGKRSNWLEWLKRLFVVALVGIGAGVWYYLSHQGSGTIIEMAYVEKISGLGQKSTIPLSDGSQVRLNAGSKIRFPRFFDGDTREVYLEGEAFFQVTRDEKRPFIVRSGDLITTVLGTSFNVKAYRNENIAVTVATGKVRVAAKAQEGDLSGDSRDQEQGANAPLILAPNEQAIYSLTVGDIQKREVEAEKYLSWSKGILRFDGARLEEVILQLSRWYGVDFQFENEGLKECLIVAQYDNATLVTVLENLKFVLGITYEFTEDGVLIDGNGCSMSN